MRNLMIGGVSLACLLILSGCDGKKGGPAPSEHEHAEFGPHGGIVVEIHETKNGEEVEAYHAEFAKDNATHTFTLYLLDIKIKNPVATDQKEIVLKLKDGDVSSKFTLTAAPQAGDPEGKTSRFQLVDEKLCEIYNKKGVTGSFDIMIDGKPHNLVPYTAPGEEEHVAK